MIVLTLTLILFTACCHHVHAVDARPCRNPQGNLCCNGCLIGISEGGAFNVPYFHSRIALIKSEATNTFTGVYLNKNTQKAKIAIEGGEMVLGKGIVKAASAVPVLGFVVSGLFGTAQKIGAAIIDGETKHGYSDTKGVNPLDSASSELINSIHAKKINLDLSSMPPMKVTLNKVSLQSICSSNDAVVTNIVTVLSGFLDSIEVMPIMLNRGAADRLEIKDDPGLMVCFRISKVMAQDIGKVYGLVSASKGVGRPLGKPTFTSESDFIPYLFNVVQRFTGGAPVESVNSPPWQTMWARPIFEKEYIAWISMGGDPDASFAEIRVAQGYDTISSKGAITFTKPLTKTGACSAKKKVHEEMTLLHRSGWLWNILQLQLQTVHYCCDDLTQSGCRKLGDGFNDVDTEIMKATASSRYYTSAARDLDVSRQSLDPHGIFRENLELRDRATVMSAFILANSHYECEISAANEFTFFIEKSNSRSGHYHKITEAPSAATGDTDYYDDERISSVTNDVTEVAQMYGFDPEILCNLDDHSSISSVDSESPSTNRASFKEKNLIPLIRGNKNRGRAHK